MTTPGIQASKLVEQLQKLIAKHGDRMVYAGGSDYPSGVGGVSLQEERDPYIPKDQFFIWTKS